MSREIPCLILAIGFMIATASLAMRLHFANDTIRLLRANAAAITPEEREAVEWAIYEGPLRSQAEGAEERADTLRKLLERTK